mmetsp:Transcript_63606/g.186626  ORF Transcript_63606/g.186626 Transcript_63606/m.186626 type:complete len:295 (-) Transcript_63606:58-942(-)
MSSSSSAWMGAPSSHKRDLGEDEDLERIYQHMLREAKSRRAADLEAEGLGRRHRPSRSGSHQVAPQASRATSEISNQQVVNPTCNSTLELPPLAVPTSPTGSRTLRKLHVDLVKKLGTVAEKRALHGDFSDSECEDNFRQAPPICLSPSIDGEREEDDQLGVPLWYQDMKKSHMEKARAAFRSTSSGTTKTGGSVSMRGNSTKSSLDMAEPTRTSSSKSSLDMNAEVEAASRIGSRDAADAARQAASGLPRQMTEPAAPVAPAPPRIRKMSAPEGAPDRTAPRHSHRVHRVAEA